MKRTCLLAIIALTLVVGTETGAFVPLRTSSGVDETWDLSRAQPNVVDGRVTFYLDPAGTRDVPPDEALAAVRAGIHSWGEVEHSRLAFVEDPTRPASRRRSGDRINSIRWATGELGPFVFGTTWPTFEGGHLVDADIVLNENVQLNSTLALLWSTQAPGGPRTADIQSVVAHEWGHAIGLDHESIHGATMYYAAYAGSTYFRTLHEDDRVAVRALYPAASAARETAVIRGVANVAGRTNDRGVHVIAIDADDGKVVTGRMSEPDGRYAIEGLPPGRYHLVAAPFVRLSTLNDWWGSSATGFLPSALTANGGNGEWARVLEVAGGEEIADADFSLDSVRDPAEPNDGAAAAWPLRIGDAIAARLEHGEDEDWYVFAGRQGQVIHARVHSAQIGGDTDPSLQLLDRDGARALRTNHDVRDLHVYGSRIEGPDTDARIASYRLPATGNYYLRVREQALVGGAGTEAFYVLTLTQDPGAPSALASGYSISPEVIHADGAATAEIRVVPRNAMGEVLGEDVTISFTTSGGGVVGPATYLGGGEYAATLTAPNGGPGDSIDVTMTHGNATATAPEALSLRYIGVVDAARSEFSAFPRRIPADGESRSRITLVPRDATGWPIGAGRAVSFRYAGPVPGADLVADDAGDGTYGWTVAAADTPGRVSFRAIVDGKDLGREATVWYGFDLLDVVTAIGIEAEDAAVVSGLPPKAMARLIRAAGQLATARSTLQAIPDAEVEALRYVKKAAKSLKKANRRGQGAIDMVPALTELAKGAREAARTAIEGAPPDGGKPLEQAQARLAAGDEALQAGKFDRAIRHYRNALRKVVTP